MNKRYLCSRHKETTPSVVVYPDHGWCFGCAQKIPLDELGVSIQEAARESSYVEDVAATIAYIRTLPKQEIRGFSLPVSARGYYLVWPCGTYYKLRVADADAKSKYRGPTGHKKPPLVASEGSRDHLVLVEGEFNALSLAMLEPRATIISPGGAGDFYSAAGMKHLNEYARYARVDVVVDSDAAGAQAAIESKAKLLVLGCREVNIHLVDTDFNDLLVSQGREALYAEAKNMGLL